MDKGLVKLMEEQPVAGNLSEEVSSWAAKYFKENREVLHVFSINNREQLIERILCTIKSNKS